VRETSALTLLAVRARPQHPKSHLQRENLDVPQVAVVADQVSQVTPE